MFLRDPLPTGSPYTPVLKQPTPWVLAPTSSPPHLRSSHTPLKRWKQNGSRYNFSTKWRVWFNATSFTLFLLLISALNEGRGNRQVKEKHGWKESERRRGEAGERLRGGWWEVEGRLVRFGIWDRCFLHPFHPLYMRLTINMANGSPPYLSLSLHSLWSNLWGIYQPYYLNVRFLFWNIELLIVYVVIITNTSLAVIVLLLLIIIIIITPIVVFEYFAWLLPEPKPQD